MGKRSTSSSDFVEESPPVSRRKGKSNCGNPALLSSSSHGDGDGENNKLKSRVVLRSCPHMNITSCSSNKSQKKFDYRHSNHFFPSPHTPNRSLYQIDDDDKDTDNITSEYFRYQDPKYPYPVNTHPLSKGSRIDLKSLLCNKNQNRDFLVTKNNTKVDVSSLKGKYVLICCFFIPVRRDSFLLVDVIVAMGALYSHLSMRNNFEMVMVAKTRSTWDSEIVFNHFFSGFHDNCLAIPYSDSASRDCIAKSLGLISGVVATLVLSPSGEILQNDSHCTFLEEYGVASFPFTDVHFDDLYKQDLILKYRLDAIFNERHAYGTSFYQDPWSPISLQELIQCDTLSKLFDEGVRVSVSDLSKKLVGLYLCQYGDFMEDLSQLQKQCIEQGLEFEIILVCLAFHDDDPQTYMNYVKIAAKEYGISSWWVLPYNDKLCRTLWRICESYGPDKLIMLPPHDGVLKSGDFNGKEIANIFGIKEYPFTKEAIIAKRESVLKSYTIESLLQEFEYVVQIQYRGWGRRLESTRVPLSDLRDKNVILYIGTLDYDTCLYKRLRECYSQIQSHHPGTQFIFVPIDDKDERSYSYDEIPPWLMMLPSTVSSDSVINKVFFLGVHPYANNYDTLIAFGKNGQMLSRNADENLPGDIPSLFRDNLRSELISDLKDVLESET